MIIPGVGFDLVVTNTDTEDEYNKVSVSFLRIETVNSVSYSKSLKTLSSVQFTPSMLYSALYCGFTVMVFPLAEASMDAGAVALGFNVENVNV